MIQTSTNGPMATSGTHSSRSGKVLVQLQQQWETIQKELASTRQQLQVAKETKKQNTLQAQEYAESNTQYRSEIQTLMRTLDSKQQQLNTTKKSSQSMETQVKKLKHEAHVARKELEVALEKHRNETEEQARLEQHYKVLKDSMASGPQREVDCLRRELQVVKAQLAMMTERCYLLSKVHESRAYQWAEEQKEKIEQLQKMRDQVQATNQTFVERVREELQALSKTAEESDGDLQAAVTRCQSEVSDLVLSIRTYAKDENTKNEDA
ncbi:hypothetical protein BDB00DRAFT_783861 [Zychaea mexicana]|uniref:uncharacterized protein n=1 Tax=Zychaea mexicana TaxID=64656 RepID=UPI0022FF22A4|nr:uncharacterized protein BDB00DRAFT_783861 [Zychaea mexicana]KAI9498759.1 hypothetical protein BDB00DRAFT_783861 [Zychaea mexicana]